MVYGVVMTMPIDLVVSEVGQQRPNVHCPVQYVEWLKGSIWDAHTLAKENLKKAAKRQKKAMVKPVEMFVFNMETGFGAFTLPLTVLNCIIRTGAHGWCWLKLVP